ncbi:MAG: hypothetical protein QOC57_1656 [Ilumatobacteraceae bacterium]
MTIRKGDSWGEPAVCPDDVRVVSTDRELRDWVVWHRVRSEAIGDIGVAAGDLARTCGGGGAAHPCSARVKVDVMRVTLDDREPTWGVAHVVARRSWLAGELGMVMNAEFLGVYDVAPRSHPNDGKLDVLRVDRSMGWRDRLRARQRAQLGNHLPHPHLLSRQLAEIELEFDQPVVVWVDGVRLGAANRVHVCDEPDAMTIYV